MVFLDFPNEILLQISEPLDVRDLGSLMRANRRLASLLAHQFYELASEDKDSLKAIHWASTYGKLGLVNLLLRNGVDIATKGTDSFKWEPLHYAVYSGNTDIVALLLEKGANVSALDSEQATPLHWAASQRRLAILKLLLEKGAPPSAQEYRGSTPLHMTALYGSPGCDELMGDMIEALLEAGADPLIPDAHGNTPLHRLVQSDKENVKAVRMMLGKGADIAARDNNGMTALHWVAKGGYVRERWNNPMRGSEVAKLLLEHGANPNIADNDGKTVFHYAAEAELQGVFQLLREKGTVPGGVLCRPVEGTIMGRFVSNLQSSQNSGR